MLSKFKDMETPLIPKLNIRNITLSQAQQLASQRCQVILKRCGTDRGQFETTTSKSEEGAISKVAVTRKETKVARNFSRIGRITVSAKLTTRQKKKKDTDCIFCDKKFVSPSHLEMHVRCHTREKPFSCSVCSASFSHGFNLKSHKLGVHSNSAKKYCCQFCEQRFHFKGSLDVHERRHSSQKAYHCDFLNCNKSFVRNADLRVHKVVHSTERPFKCNLCEKVFARKPELEVHCRRHTGEKPYICHVCSKRFPTTHSLREHKLHKHDPPELRRFHCLFCQKAYVAKSQLEEHISTHTKEMPYACLSCGESFRWRGVFQKHCKAKGHRQQE